MKELQQLNTNTQEWVTVYASDSMHDIDEYGIMHVFDGIEEYASATREERRNAFYNGFKCGYIRVRDTEPYKWGF